ncbi:acetylglutamate kinase [Weeksellaceae bacterium A-14]
MQDLFIIKIGGDTLNSPEILEKCIKACAKSGKNIILNHGGGKKVTELASKLGIQQQIIEGRRITSPETLDLCTMIYAGLINKNIVAGFYKNGKTAAGLSGADFGCIISEKRQHTTVNYGMVGDVRKVDAGILAGFVEKGIIPVLCSITLGENGDLLNTNADTIASEIAKAMSAKYRVHLLYCFEKNGVLTDISNENSVLKTITQKTFNEMKDTRQIADGMIPKLHTAMQVLRHGVEEVRIINSGKISSYFAGEEPGTQIMLH